MGYETDGSNVVDFGRARSETVPRVLRQVEAYWDGLRAGRLVPDRCDINPRGLEGALANAFLLERIAPGLARIRIAGRFLSELMGIEVHGLPFSTLFEPEARDPLADAMTAVYEEPAMVELTLRSPGGFGRRPLTGKAVLLPLRNDLGDISRVLGAVVTDGTLGRRPRRFEITGQSRRTLIGYGRSPSPAPDLRPIGEGEPRGLVISLVPRGED